MPIVPSIITRRLSQKEFGALAYEVMDHVFAIHDDFGHFFDEKIYKKELASRMKGVDLVGHEFVNCHRRLVQLRNPTFIDNAWDQTATGAEVFRDRLTSLIHDWGTGLDLALYEEGLEHFFNKEQSLESAVPVFGASGHLADQHMRLVTPDSAFKLTALSKPSSNLLINARKLLRHTPLKAIHWANLTHDQITLTTIRQ